MIKKILLIDDEENILTTLQGSLEDEDFEVETARTGSQGLALSRSFQPDLVLLDIWMPSEDGIEILQKLKLCKHNSDLPVIMMSGHATIDTAVKAIKLGAFDFLEKPIDFEKLLVLIQHVSQLRQLQHENRYLRQTLETNLVLIGQSEPMLQLKRMIEIISPSNGWVLIQGENGTGKEIVARSIHKGSLRSYGPFIAINCAAIPDELIESELFGHEKGSFTGALEKKIGKFEQAQGGTIFLDEVGDMGPKMQAKILRVLQELQIQRVGGTSLIELDIRVIAATNKDLQKMMKKGDFREDLFYRLNVIPIRMPTLRERKEDLIPLIKHFLQLFSKKTIESIPEKTFSLLKTYPWFGNVRELKNWVERYCILSSSPDLEEEQLLLDDFKLDDFKLSVDNPKLGEIPMEIFGIETKNFKQVKADFERNFILKMLEENDWNISKTAQIIGLERSHLHKKMRTYGIENLTYG